MIAEKNQLHNSPPLLPQFKISSRPDAWGGGDGAKGEVHTAQIVGTFVRLQKKINLEDLIAEK